MTRKLFPAFALAVFVSASCAQSSTDDRRSEPTPPAAIPPTTAGRALFLKNCAHCHGADAHGDDGPDLHSLDWPAGKIAAQIRNGRKGQMTSFAGKLPPADIDALVGYLRALK